MVSPIITSIDTALNYLYHLLKTRNYPDVYLGVWNLIFWLRNLKTFVLCARKLTNNTSLGSFLARMEDTIRKWAEEIHLQGFHVYQYGGWSPRTMLDKIIDEFKSLEEEVDKWYVTLLDHPQNSTSFTAHELLDIIIYILDDRMGTRYVKLKWRVLDFDFLREAMEALIEQLRFLASLLWLTTQASEDFLAHSEIVVLHAASLIFAFRVDEFDEESGREMQLKISTLVQRVKPINPQVYEVYTQVLSGSEVLRDSRLTLGRHTVLNTLISNLWEILQLDTCVVFVKVQLKELYGGLRSLRYILNQHPNKFDFEIGAVLCDAAVLIWPFYRANPVVDLGLQALLQTIKNILVKVGEQDPQIPKFDFQRTNELGFLDVLLERLMALTTSKAEPIAKSHVEVIQEELVFLRPFLGEMVELRNEQEEPQPLWNRVFAVVNKTESLVDHPVVGDLPDSLLTSFDSVIKDIMEIKADVLNTFYGKRQETEVKEATSTYNQMPSQRIPSVGNEVVGFDNEAKSIMERLTRRSQKLCIIAIVGMAGSGKTTLATRAFNDPFVMHHFQVRAWCSISQTLNKKKVLLELLNQIDPLRNFDHDKIEQDFTEKLRQRLKGRRYLVFLDDVWEIEAWNRLTGNGLLFPDDAVGSRIILTSRRHDAAPRHMLDQEPHSLRQLEKKESLELLQKKLLPQKGWPFKLHDILVQIAEVCKGLPLTLVIVAGLLAATDPGGWKKILDDLSFGLGSVTARCKNTLELSYQNLPNHLRSCLLYFGAFQEDQEVSVRKLVRLWIAEGFVQKTEVKTLEHAAEDYVKDLIGRSLIMVAKQRSDGGVKTCRIHDLLHDFCLEKAKNEYFFHFLRGRCELLAFSEPCNLRRLCIHSEAEHFKRSQLFCPGARSLLFNCTPVMWERYEETEELLNISFVIHAFRLLKVLDLQRIYLVTGFPDEIVLLVQLAFLAIGGKIKHIPSSIARISNLKTLILDTDDEPLLPGSLWNLQKLQYLYIRVYSLLRCYGGGILPIKNLDSSPILYELDSFSGAAIPSGSMGRLLKKFPNIRRLKCRLLRSAGGEDEGKDTIVVVDFQSQLESLHILYNDFSSNIFEFSFPKTLKKLSLTSLRLTLRSISMIGKLPTLEVLKFKLVRFEGNTWEMKEGEFLNLRFLKLSYIEDLKWTACDDQIGCLQKLVLDWITHFKEIPSYLESIPTLEMIDVSDCSRCVIEMVRQIEEQQLMWGNSSLKITVGRIRE